MLFSVEGQKSFTWPTKHGLAWLTSLGPRKATLSQFPYSSQTYLLCSLCSHLKTTAFLPSLNYLYSLFRSSLRGGCALQLPSSQYHVLFFFMAPIRVCNCIFLCEVAWSTFYFPTTLYSPWQRSHLVYFLTMYLLLSMFSINIVLNKYSMTKRYFKYTVSAMDQMFVSL